MDRCRREIAAVEAQIRAGNPDLQGLCLALADWSAELLLIEGEKGTERKKARRAVRWAGWKGECGTYRLRE